MAAAFIKYVGPLTLDLTGLGDRLVDIEAGGMQGLRPDLEGFPDVVHELAHGVPSQGAAAGVPQDAYEHFVMCNETVAAIEQTLAIASKQVEVLKESLAYYKDARQNDIGLIVDAIKSRAQRRKDKSVLLSFEKTLKYQRQVGDKAARTRKQNAKNTGTVPGEGNAVPPTNASQPADQPA